MTEFTGNITIIKDIRIAYKADLLAIDSPLIALVKIHITLSGRDPLRYHP
jgi:hypothetical protein